MTQQAYKEAIADLRKWHEGDRFMKHFDDIEAHVNALATPMHGVSEVEVLPPPTSILLTRNGDGRLCNPATGEPFPVVIDTIDGRREITHINFAGERDEPKPLPDPVLVDPEPDTPAGGGAVVNVIISDLREDELRAALQRAVEDQDAAKLLELAVYADRATLMRILPPSMELAVALNHGTASNLLEVVKAALESPTVGLQVVPAEPISPEKAESVFAAVRSALDLSDADPSPFASVQGVGDVPPATSMEPSEIKHEGEPPTIDGLPVVPADGLITGTHTFGLGANPPITLGTLSDFKRSPEFQDPATFFKPEDDEAGDADESDETGDIANTSDGGVPTDGEVPAKPSRKTKARKKAGS